MKKLALYITVLTLISHLNSCKKYLDEKPDIKLAIPTTLSDFQILLDQPKITDGATSGVSDLGTDDYYLAYPIYQSKILVVRNCYIWEKDIWGGQSSADWGNMYGNIYIANVVLEGLKDFEVVSGTDQAIKDKIYAHALFVRAMMHYSLEETFGQPYKSSTASSELGVPLKMTANLASVAVRSSVADVFAQIIQDLQEAKNILPNTTPARNRPSKAAAFGMLARVYLTMQNYEKAGLYADSSLQISNTLRDFDQPPLSTVTATSSNPFSSFSSPNDFIEVLYPCNQFNYNLIRTNTTNIDSLLLNSYHADDRRKFLFFLKNNSTNTYSFRGNYSGTSLKQFSGPGVDEMYLTRAECYARAGNKDAALIDLNALIVKRWKNTVPYVLIVATDAEDALRKVLNERRKELIFRGIRWTDLRRLNQDTRFAVTLIRVLNGQTYTLPPNSPKYTYPIPDDEIRLSGIPQNPR